MKSKELLLWVLAVIALVLSVVALISPSLKGMQSDASAVTGVSTRPVIKSASSCDRAEDQYNSVVAIYGAGSSQAQAAYEVWEAACGVEQLPWAN